MKISTTTAATITTTSPSTTATTSPATTATTSPATTPSTSSLTTTLIASPSPSDSLPHQSPPSLPFPFTPPPRKTATLLPSLRKWLRIKRCKLGKRRLTSARIKLPLDDSDDDVWGLLDEDREPRRGRKVVRRKPVAVDLYAPSGSGSGGSGGSRSAGEDGNGMSWRERRAERKEEKRVERWRARLERIDAQAEVGGMGSGAGWGWMVRRALSWEG